jgi:ectoine hydroxylase-related dioxygenase (phytanoyl-CoA dioxygenase family)
MQASHPELMHGVEAQKLHLVTTWMADIVRTPDILDAVECLLGPDLLCWTSTLFVKPPDGKSFVSWHQDGNYWGLSNPEIVSAWLALSPSTVESGCMRMVPASHTWDTTVHDETFDADNLLSRGQVMQRAFDGNDAVDLVLNPRGRKPDRDRHPLRHAECAPTPDRERQRDPRAWRRPGRQLRT